MKDDNETNCDWSKVPEYSKIISKKAFSYVDNLINDIYEKDTNLFEDKKQIRKMIFDRKTKKINITIGKLQEEIGLLDGWIHWEINGKLNDIYDERFGKTLQEMQEKKANLEKNLHIQKKWLENLTDEFNNYNKEIESKRPTKESFSMDLNSVGLVTNKIIRKS
jgi:hypothetical protein